MIYKVQFQIHRRGYRKLRLEGLYVPETGVEMSVPEMKRDVTEFIKRQLSSRNKYKFVNKKDGAGRWN